jgi:hypothetical protein
MSVDARSGTRSPAAASAARVITLRRVSLAVLVLLVVEYGIGMYVNLYVTVPGADHGGGMGAAIANGPAVLSLHAVIGPLLALGALGVLVRAAVLRYWAACALSAAGLFAIAFAGVTGVAFASTGGAADSMAMSVMTGVALVCYAGILYATPRA